MAWLTGTTPQAERLVEPVLGAVLATTELLCYGEQLEMLHRLRIRFSFVLVVD